MSKQLARLLAGLFVLMFSACAADRVLSADATAQQQSRSAELYYQTFGAETPVWSKLPEAFHLWTELANAGDAKAMYYLSNVYFRGVPDLVSANSDLAIGLLRKAADAGEPDAQFALAWHLESGVFLKSKPSEAVRLYEQSASGGSALAMSRLARIYAEGELNEPINTEKARFWRDRLNQLRQNSTTD